MLSNKRKLKLRLQVYQTQWMYNLGCLPENCPQMKIAVSGIKMSIKNLLYITHCQDKDNNTSPTNLTKDYSFVLMRHKTTRSARNTAILCYLWQDILGLIEAIHGYLFWLFVVLSALSHNKTYSNNDDHVQDLRIQSHQKKICIF